MAVEKREYDAAFGQEALRLLEISGKSVRQIENDLGITPGLLNKWNSGIACIRKPETGKPSDERELEAENLAVTP
ncbi:MAG: transposase [Anaerolineae bacterium]